MWTPPFTIPLALPMRVWVCVALLCTISAGVGAFDLQGHRGTTGAR
jgi:hypothetical protein